MSGNQKGTLLVTGGQDGKVCLWQWGRDAFLHQVAEIYTTNLPVLSAKFTNAMDTAITIAVESYVINYKVIRKTSQQYHIEQDTQRQIKMLGDHRLLCPHCLVLLHHHNDDHQGQRQYPMFLTLRTSRLFELISSDFANRPVLLDERPTGLCADQQWVIDPITETSVVYTAVALMASADHPIAYIWRKQEAASSLIV